MMAETDNPKLPPAKRDDRRIDEERGAISKEKGDRNEGACITDGLAKVWTRSDEGRRREEGKLGRGICRSALLYIGTDARAPPRSRTLLLHQRLPRLLQRK